MFWKVTYRFLKLPLTIGRLLGYLKKVSRQLKPNIFLKVEVKD